MITPADLDSLSARLAAEHKCMDGEFCPTCAIELSRLLDDVPYVIAAMRQAWAERDSLRLELDGLEHIRLRDNEHLIKQRDAAREALREYDRKLQEVWGKQDDPYAIAYGWTKTLRDRALATPDQAEPDPCWTNGEPIRAACPCCEIVAAIRVDEDGLCVSCGTQPTLLGRDGRPTFPARPVDEPASIHYVAGQCATLAESVGSLGCLESRPRVASDLGVTGTVCQVMAADGALCDRPLGHYGKHCCDYGVWPGVSKVRTPVRRTPGEWCSDCEEALHDNEHNPEAAHEAYDAGMHVCHRAGTGREVKT